MRRGYKVTDKMRPLTGARLRWGTATMKTWKYERSPEGYIVRDEEGIRQKKWTGTTQTEVLRCSFKSIFNWIDEMNREAPGLLDEDKDEEYWKNTLTCDYWSRDRLIKHIYRGHSTTGGWNAYKEFKRKINTNPESVSKLGSLGIDTRRKRRASLAGCIVNFDKVMTGLNPMETLSRQNSQRSVRVFVDYCMSGGESIDKLLELTSNAIAICARLEKKGFATQIDFGDTTYLYPGELRRSQFKVNKGHKKEGAFVLTKFVGKQSGEKLNETKLVNYAQGGVFRDIMFHYQEHHLGFPSGLGIPASRKLKPEDDIDFYKSLTGSDIYIGHNDELTDIMTNIVGHIAK
tara:strand:- start:21004 stop:22041 length:1038 start_codon:yes stop_codon:yes gene_type:complete